MPKTPASFGYELNESMKPCVPFNLQIAKIKAAYQKDPCQTAAVNECFMQLQKKGWILNEKGQIAKAGVLLNSPDGFCKDPISHSYLSAYLWLLAFSKAIGKASYKTADLLYDAFGAGWNIALYSAYKGKRKNLNRKEKQARRFIACDAAYNKFLEKEPAPKVKVRVKDLYKYFEDPCPHPGKTGKMVGMSLLNFGNLFTQWAKSRKIK